MSYLEIKKMFDEYEENGVFEKIAKAISDKYRKDHPRCRKCGKTPVEKEGNMCISCMSDGGGGNDPESRKEE